MTQDLQNLFNTAVAGLASQGFERSLAKNGLGHNACMYRGEHGRRCALGWCIEDRFYNPGMEGLTPYSGMQIMGLFPGVSANKLAKLQAAHDLGKDPEDMKKRLREFAFANGLIVPEALR